LESGRVRAAQETTTAFVRGSKRGAVRAKRLGQGRDRSRSDLPGILRDFCYFWPSDATKDAENDTRGHYAFGRPVGAAEHLAGYTPVRVADLLFGPVLAFAGLLALAGITKIRDPHPAVDALRGARVPAGMVAVRGLGVAELAVAVVGVVVGGPIGAAAIGAAFAIFTAYVALVRFRGGSSETCGCFGQADAPTIAPLHLLLTVAGAGLAAAEFALGGSGLTQVGVHGLLAAVFFAFSAWCVYLLFVAFTALPRALAELGATN